MATVIDFQRLTFKSFKNSETVTKSRVQRSKIANVAGFLDLDAIFADSFSVL